MSNTATYKGQTIDYRQDYLYEPVGLDLFDAKPHQPEPGTEVRPIRPPYGCPNPVAMGMIYVQDAESSEFRGLVNIASLVG